MGMGVSCAAGTVEGNALGQGATEGGWGTPKDSFPEGNKAIARRAGGLFLPCQQLLSLAGEFSECNESGEGTEAAPEILLLSAGWSCLGSGITN